MRKREIIVRVCSDRVVDNFERSLEEILIKFDDEGYTADVKFFTDIHSYNAMIIAKRIKR